MAAQKVDLDTSFLITLLPNLAKVKAGSIVITGATTNLFVITFLVLVTRWQRNFEKNNSHYLAITGINPILLVMVMSFLRN